MKVVFAILFLLIGCGGPRGEKLRTWDDGIYDLRTGERVDESDLKRHLQAAKVVIVAESHDNVIDHARQLDVLNMVPHAAVGMEMFQRPFQEHLDAYVEGTITEEEMLERTEWETRWGFETQMYQPFWRLAKDEGRKLIALNLRREITKKISGAGIASLDDETRAILPEHDLSDDAYKAWLFDIFSSHGAVLDDVTFNRFFEAQVMWDETMADSAVRALEHSKSVVVIVGRGHVERDWGIPSRVRRRLGAELGDGTVISVVPTGSELPAMAVLRSQTFADFIWVQARD